MEKRNGNFADFDAEDKTIPRGPESWPSEIQQCKVCDNPTRSFCKSCSSAFYCCKDHQKAHWKIHKNECFPIRVVVNDPSFGRLMVASQDLTQGQRILEEVPILITPNTRSENGITCLGCCKKLTLTTAVPCIRCGWPLCGVQCDMESLHTTNECIIFKERAIQSSMGNLGNSYQTLCEIGVLRMLLLIEREPRLWKRLLKLDSFKQTRKQVADKMFNLNSIICFIRQEVSMDIEEDLIDTAFGILRGNAFDTSDYIGFIDCCS
ncbi:Zinc finger MYND domain-containing protein 12 [Folsomia candida]|uniref:Zinc finger MYND domain-containing protein 12 n=2 Tax=Folsomia candida TaxID=158441 RepID=A0A226F616_FOLCA|nr:Zinc finger MYND domain-containing protein 12 [Folsomia candida]